MNSKIKFLAAMLTLSVLAFPAAAKAKPHSLKTSAAKMNSEKKAIAAAENYELSPLEAISGEFLGKYEVRKFYGAYNPENNECVIFLDMKGDKFSNVTNIVYSYCNLGGKADSRVEYIISIGKFYLNSEDKTCELDASNYYITDEVYSAQTREMVFVRNLIERKLKEEYGIEFVAKVHPDQKQFKFK